MTFLRSVAGAFPAPRRAVSTAFFINGFSLGSWAPQTPFVAERLGIGEALLGLVILGIGIGALIALAAVGAAMARGGSRGPTLICQAALALTFPLLTIAPTLPLAIAAAMLVGAGMGGMDAAMNANAVATEERLGAAVMSSCHGFWSLGGFAGAFLGGPLIAVTTPEVHGLVVGLVILASLIGVTPALTSDRPPPRQAPARSGPAFERLRAALRERDLRSAVLLASALGIFALLAFSAEGIAIDWSAIYLTRNLEVTTAYSGLAFAAFSVTMATMRFAGDTLRQRFGAVRVVAVSLLVGASGLAGIAMASSLAGAVAGFMLMGCGLANLVPVAFSAAGQIRRLPAGVGIAIATGFGYSGALVTPSVVGYAAQHFGFPAVFVAMACVLLALLAVAPQMWRADRSSES